MFSVLFVDDEPDLLEVAKLHLEKDGAFSVDTCHSASRALSAMKEKNYDAVIADYDMPVMTGLDLLRELKSKGDTTPFIMLTGVDLESVVMDTLNSGATYYLKKGADLDAPFGDLSHKLNLAVRGRNAKKNLGLFTAVTRHDLLNRIAALYGYVDLVKSQTDDATIHTYMQKQKIILSTIREQIQFIEDYEKVGTTDPAWQSPLPLIRQAAALLPADHLSLMTDGIDTVELSADPLLIKVFYNLIDNSLRHGKHVTQVRISGSETGEGFLITYEDNGIGVPARDKDSIFLRGKGKNTGLGLFLIREILAITDIRIRENGTPGSGVRFEILVPQQRFRFRS